MSAMPTSIQSVKTFALSELEKATDKFSSRRILGEGGFGRVYFGLLEDGNEVAVKLLTRDNQNGDREFIAEVEMLSRLHHRNLVKLIGICIDGRTRCLVYELVHNGSVESHLHGIFPISPTSRPFGHLLTFLLCTADRCLHLLYMVCLMNFGLIASFSIKMFHFPLSFIIQYGEN